MPTTQTKNMIFHKIQKYGWAILPFISSLTLLRCSPMMYDGWTGPSYYDTYGGLLNWSRYIFGPFRNYINGRVASNFISGILESFQTELPLDIFGACILTGIYCCLVCLYKIQNGAVSSVIYTSLLILMPYMVREYVVQIALLQYLAPVLFFLLMLIFLEKYKVSHERKYALYLYPLSILACTWMENTSVAYGIVLFGCAVYEAYSKRNFDRILFGAVLVAFGAGVFMITAPGMSSSRITAEGAAPFLQFTVSRLLVHSKAFVKSFIYKACLPNFCIALLLAMLQFSRVKNGKKVAAILMAMVDIVLAIAFLALGFYTNEFQYTAEINTGLYYQVYQQNANIFILVFVLYLVWIAGNVQLSLGKNKKLNLFLLYGIISIAIILPTNQVGERIYSPYYIVVVGIVSVLFSEAMSSASVQSYMRKCQILMLGLVFLLAIDFQTQLCRRLFTVQSKRTQCIEWIQEKQYFSQEEEDTWYVIPVFNERDAYLGGVTALGEFHYPSFLSRYGLDSDTQLIFTNSPMYMTGEQMQGGIHIQVHNQQSGNWKYVYTVSYKNTNDEDQRYTAIEQQSVTEEDDYFAVASSGKGYYKVEAVAINQDTNQQVEVNAFEQYIG